LYNLILEQKNEGFKNTSGNVIKFMFGIKFNLPVRAFLSVENNEFNFILSLGHKPNDIARRVEKASNIYSIRILYFCKVEYTEIKKQLSFKTLLLVFYYPHSETKLHH